MIEYTISGMNFVFQEATIRSSLQGANSTIWRITIDGQQAGAWDQDFLEKHAVRFDNIWYGVKYIKIPQRHMQDVQLSPEQWCPISSKLLDSTWEPGTKEAYKAGALENLFDVWRSRTINKQILEEQLTEPTRSKRWRNIEQLCMKHRQEFVEQGYSQDAADLVEASFRNFDEGRSKFDVLRDLSTLLS